MSYDLGDTVPITVEVRDADGELVAPTSTSLEITLESGVVVPGTAFTEVSTGLYRYLWTATVEGLHDVYATSTGPATAYSDVIDVRSRARGYLMSLADARRCVKFTTTDRDEELRDWMESTTRVVERYLQRVVKRRTITELHEVGTARRDRIALYRQPAISITSVESLDGATVWDLPNLDLYPGAAVLRVIDGAWLTGNVVVSYLAGSSGGVPANYRDAAKVILQHLWETQRPQARGTSRSRSMDTPGAGFTGFGYALPNAAKELLGEEPAGGFA